MKNFKKLFSLTLFCFLGFTSLKMYSKTSVADNLDMAANFEETKKESFLFSKGERILNTWNASLPKTRLRSVIEKRVFASQWCLDFRPTNGRLYVDNNVLMSGDGSAWDTAIKELADALEYARTCGAGKVSEIWVGQGMYLPLYAFAEYDVEGEQVTERDFTFLIPENISVFGGFNGTENNLTDRDPINNLTLLSGDVGFWGDVSDDCYHVVLVPGEEGRTVLDGFTIIYGSATGVSSTMFGEYAVDQTKGAGLYVLSKSAKFSPVFENLHIIYNEAVDGAGIYIEYSKPFFNRLTLNYNYAGNLGGGLYGHSSNATFVNSLIVSNWAMNLGGGAYQDGAHHDYINVTMSNNTSYSDFGGGCAYIAGSDFNLKNSIVYGNQPAGNFINSSYAIFENSLVEGLNPGGNNLDGTNVDNDPQFVDMYAWEENGYNFKLLSTSLLINRGKNSLYDSARFGNTDLIGTNRINDDLIDLGAFEQSCVSASFLTQDMTVCIGSVSELKIKFSGVNAELPYKYTLVTSTALSTDTVIGFSNELIHKLEVSPEIKTTYKLLNSNCAKNDSSIRDSVVLATIFIPDPVAQKASKGHILHVNKNVAASGDGLTWETAFEDLADALHYVHTCGFDVVKEIWVAEGTYYPKYTPTDIDKSAKLTTDRDKTFLLPHDIAIYGGFKGDETSLTERKWREYPTILSGDLNQNDETEGDFSENVYHVVMAVGQDGGLTLDGFTITGGKADVETSLEENLIYDSIYRLSRRSGAGIYILSNVDKIDNSKNYQFHPIFQNLIITQNTAESGGGLFMGHSAPYLNRVTLRENMAEKNGGAIFSSSSKSCMSNVLITANGAVYYGGGILFDGAHDEIHNATIVGNQSWLKNSGGGLAFIAGSYPVIKNSIITNNFPVEDEINSSYMKFYNSYMDTENFVKHTSWSYDCFDKSILDGKQLFVDPEGVFGEIDFRLAEECPLIDKGKNELYDLTKFGNLDLNDSTRISGDNIDLGAYEFQHLNLGIPLSIRVFLEGAFLEDGTMRNSIQVGFSEFTLPKDNPYLVSGVSYAKISDPSGPAGKIVDWIQVLIHDVSNPGVEPTSETRALLLNTDGYILDTDGKIPTFKNHTGTVYIQVIHRNHLNVVSQAISMSSINNQYDFTTDLSKASSSGPNPMVKVNNVYCMWSGDVNQDGYINSTDLIEVLKGAEPSKFEEYIMSDVNLDGYSDSTDLILVYKNSNENLYSPATDW